MLLALLAALSLTTQERTPPQFPADVRLIRLDVSVVANSLVPALNRIGGELRTYDVVGYVPPRADDGRFRSVKVNVDGVKARTKKGYLASGREAALR